ncbi:hypothetical protein GUJ93_ZPchr0011g28451 [Zizania palustris]|uniref:Fibronectin type III-like domain-containing protein n=1 Tax=Zizania palustris TaxID=103762 RepID=A0A8J6BLP5_ZIZPA|nr:hypothetical protein GUJ93_ZPchr0011g28451 [Zizania palustris]
MAAAAGMLLVLTVMVMTTMPAVLLFSQLAEAGDPSYSCGPAGGSPSDGGLHAFCNRSLTAAERASDLVARLTVAEKVAQLGDQADGVPRLGVPPYKWWSEALHGLSIWGHGMHFDGIVRSVTCFPQVLLTAASFDDNLWLRIGQAIGVEARALYNLGQAEGLTIWSPNVNIFRDPRWGRGQETPGEDPATASRYAVAFVRGLQGSSPAALQTSACCKHATAYDLEDWNGAVRYNFNAKVTAQDLADTYNPPFKSCVADAKATCIMCAYTRLNGVPVCASSDLLTKTVRDEWGLQGYVCSDCDAVANMRDYTPSPEDTVAVAIKAGLDLDCGNYTQVHGMAAIQQGKMTEKDVDKAVTNLFTVRMRLGHFDGDPRNNGVYGHLGAADVCTQAHKDLALEAARDGIVLLKTTPASSRSTGRRSTACEFAATGQAVALASSSDHVILFMGLSQKQEQEGLDRTSLLLPGMQQSLITAVASAAKRPVILVLLTGGPVDITFAKNNPKIGGIMWAGYPGQAGGLAIAKVLFGEHNPSGRLPVTWYPEEFTKGNPVYKFGYGLSYSNFSRRLVSGTNPGLPNTSLLAGLTAKPTADGGATYHVDEIGAEGCEQLKFPAVVEVQNHGPMDGKHSVLMFVRWPNATAGVSRPARQLVGFQSQHVKAGENVRVRFEPSLELTPAIFASRFLKKLENLTRSSSKSQNIRMKLSVYSQDFEKFHRCDVDDTPRGENKDTMNTICITIADALCSARGR